MIAMIKADNKVRRAKPLFKAELAKLGYKCPSDIPEYLERWWQRFKAHRDVRDAPGRGAKSHVDNRIVEAVAQLFIKGYLTEDLQQKHYTSFQAAVRYDPEISTLVEHSGVTAKTFFGHVRKVRARLSRI